MIPREEVIDSSPVLLGTSRAARGLREDIRAACRASCVLIEAEPGSAALDIAGTIHREGGRDGQFLVLECGDTDPADLERELFGVTERAASDLEAIGGDSRLALARGGSLYIADLQELPAPAQARLARVIRDQAVRVGDETSRLDVCLIAGVPSDVDAQAGRLRSDLLRRFSRARVLVPPLRNRAEDLPAIVECLTSTLSGDAGQPARRLTQAAMTLLCALPWRGNLVELRHALARVVSTVDGPMIQLEDVLTHVRFDGTLVPPVPAGTLRAARQQFERDYIALVLQHHRGRVGDAARALGIQRTNLYRKARQLRIPMARLTDRSRA